MSIIYKILYIISKGAAFMYAERIKEIRKELNLSAAKMAEKIKIPVRTITGYERAERTPSIEFAAQCCIILNINANWFLTGHGAMFNSEKLDNLDDRITLKVEQILKEKGLI